MIRTAALAGACVAFVALRTGPASAAGQDGPQAPGGPIDVSTFRV
jgi:hypothetical protein